MGGHTPERVSSLTQALERSMVFHLALILKEKTCSARSFKGTCTHNMWTSMTTRRITHSSNKFGSRKAQLEHQRFLRQLKAACVSDQANSLTCLPPTCETREVKISRRKWCHSAAVIGWMFVDDATPVRINKLDLKSDVGVKRRTNHASTRRTHQEIETSVIEYVKEISLINMPSDRRQSNPLEWSPTSSFAWAVALVGYAMFATIAGALSLFSGQTPEATVDTIFDVNKEARDSDCMGSHASQNPRSSFSCGGHVHRCWMDHPTTT